MKTLVRNDNQISLYIFDDSEIVNIAADATYIGNPLNLIISDCNLSNVTLYENVAAPEDWFGWKYTFDGTNFVANPDWVDPEQARLQARLEREARQNTPE